MVMKPSEDEIPWEHFSLSSRESQLAHRSFSEGGGEAEMSKVMPPPQELRTLPVSHFE